MCLAKHGGLLKVHDGASCGHVLAMLDKRGHLELSKESVGDVFVDKAVAVGCGDDEVNFQDLVLVTLLHTIGHVLHRLSLGLAVGSL